MNDKPATLDVERVESLGVELQRQYVLLALKYNQPPSDAVVERGQYDSLEEIVIPPPNDRVGFIVYDGDGTAYTRDDL